MKKTAMMLAAVLAMSAFAAGCSEKKKTSGDNDGTALECMVDMNKINPNSTQLKEMEEELGVDIKCIAAPTGSSEDVRKAINLQIASGDIPEMLTNVKFPDYYTYAQQGLLAEIPVEMIKSEAPDVAKWIEDNLYGEATWDYYKVNGKNYVLPSIWTIGEKFSTIVVREDWLNEAGYSEMPDTLEEFEDAMLKIKAAKKIYPLTGMAGTYKGGVYDFVFGAYGIYPKSFTEKDGKIVYGAVEPEAKEALTVLNRWYKEGIIDPEFTINTSDKVLEKWIAEKSAATISAFYHAIPAEAYWGGNFYDKLTEKDPDAKIATMKPPAGPNGERGITQDNPIVNAGICLSKTLENNPEKMKKYLQLCNYILKENEKLNIGKEGVTFKYDDEGNVEMIPPYDEDDAKFEYGIVSATVVEGFENYDIQFAMKPKKYEDIRNTALNNCMGKYDILGPAPRPVYQKRQETLDRITDQNIVNFITGERSLDEFDNFVKEWMSAGGTEVLKEAQEYYGILGLNNREKKD